MSSGRLADVIARRERNEQLRKAAGEVDGKHYTQHVDEVKALMESRDYDAAAGLLLRLIEAVELEATIPLAGISGFPTWFYRQLSTAYERLGADRQAELVKVRMQVQEAKSNARNERATAELRDAATGESQVRAQRKQAGIAHALGKLAAHLLRQFRR